MYRTKNLARKNSKIPRWVPAALVVSVAIALLFFRGGDATSATSGSGDNHDRGGTQPDETRDDNDPPDHEGADDVSTSGARDEEEDGGDEGPESETETSCEDDGFVVLTEAEIGQEIRSACSCTTFQPYLGTVVREGCNSLRPDRHKSTCCGKYEFLQKRDPRAAVLFGDAEAFEEQDHLRLKNTITTVISIPANPASLEETLRLLGRRNFAHASCKLEDPHYSSLCNVLMQALGETLEQEVSHLSVARDWTTFMSTLWQCSTITGDIVRPSLAKGRVDCLCEEVPEGMESRSSTSDGPAAVAMGGIGAEQRRQIRPY